MNFTQNHYGNREITYKLWKEYLHDGRVMSYINFLQILKGLEKTYKVIMLIMLLMN